MRNFILVTLSAVIGCANQVPQDHHQSVQVGDEASGQASGDGQDSSPDQPLDDGPQSQEDDDPEAKPDADGDGFSKADGDCDDADASISPGHAEQCDGRDNDCDGQVDESDAEDATWFYPDADRDGYGALEGATLACEQPDGDWVGHSGDCNDAEPLAWQGAAEICDGVDNDCNGAIDEGAAAPVTWYLDADGDGYGAADHSEVACGAPGADWVHLAGDCDDALPEVNPGAEEVCSSVDRDCDGDPGVEIATWFGDDGSIEDVTDGMSSIEGTLSLGSSGTLRICEGHWTTRVEVLGDDVTIKGVGDAQEVVLDGGGAGSTITSRSSNEQLTVRGLVVTGGDAVRGGGLRAEGADVSIYDAFIEDNDAQVAGGGIYMASGHLRLEDTEVSGNSVSATDVHTYGAGIRVETGTALLEGATIYGNAGLGEVYGGGVSGGEADISLRLSVVEYNEASMSGGGIQVGAGTVTLVDSAVRFNEAGAYGGGVKVSGALDMTDSLIKDNTAQINGGGAYVAMGDGERTPSLVCRAALETLSGFRGNHTAEGLGGAVYSAALRFELESDGCDWGADGTENTPEDVRTRHWVGNAYGDASFECNASRGCGEGDDMWTRLR